MIVGSLSLSRDVDTASTSMFMLVSWFLPKSSISGSISESVSNTMPFQSSSHGYMSGLLTSSSLPSQSSAFEKYITRRLRWCFVVICNGPRLLFPVPFRRRCIAINGVIYINIYIYIYENVPWFLSNFSIKLELACDLLIGVKSCCFLFVSRVYVSLFFVP